MVEICTRKVESAPLKLGVMAGGRAGAGWCRAALLPTVHRGLTGQVHCTMAESRSYKTMTSPHALTPAPLAPTAGTGARLRVRRCWTLGKYFGGNFRSEKSCYLNERSDNPEVTHSQCRKFEVLSDK